MTWYPTKLVGDIVDILKGSPLLLALVLLNCVLLVLVYLGTNDLRAKHSEQMMALIKECFQPRRTEADIPQQLIAGIEVSRWDE